MHLYSFQSLLFIYYVRSYPFAFLMICSSACKTEYNFGRRPIYSAIGVQDSVFFISTSYESVSVYNRVQFSPYFFFSLL